MPPPTRPLLCCLLACSAATGARNAAAETAAAPAEWFGAAPWSAWSALTGDWDGARRALAGHGVTILATVTNEGSAVLHDGVPPGSPAPRAGQRILVNAGTVVDLQALAGFPGATLSATYQYAGGDPASARTGDAQGWSNISVDADINQLSECWYQQRFGIAPGGDDLVRVKLGKIDGNVDFDALPAQADFFSSAAAYSLCFQAMPTYPNPATGVTAFIQPRAGCTLGVACFDATTVVESSPTGRAGARGFVDHGLRADKLWVVQAGVDWTPRGSGATGDLAFVGAYAVDGDGTTPTGAVPAAPGWFAGAEQDVWNGAGGRALTASVRAAGTGSGAGRLDRHLAGGLWSKGTFAGRQADGAGLFVSDVRFTAGAGGPPARHETECEATYALQACGWWLVRLDLQYIRHPGGSLDPDHALVVALRSDLTL